VLVAVVSPAHRCLFAELMAPAWRPRIRRQPADRPRDRVDGSRRQWSATTARRPHAPDRWSCWPLR